MILSSLVPFLYYLSYWHLSHNSICPLSLNLTIIQSLTIMNGIIFFFSIASGVLTLPIVYRAHKLLDFFEGERRN